MGRGIDAVGSARDNRPAPFGEVSGDFAGHVPAVPGGGPRPHHRHRAHAGRAQVRMPPQPQRVRAGPAELVKRAGPFGVPGADQPDAVAAGARDALVVRQAGQPDSPAAKRAFERRPARRAVAASRTGPGQHVRLDRGQYLGRLADPEQGAERGIAGLGQVGERGPGQLFLAELDRRGGLAHRRTPSHRPSAVAQSSLVGRGRPARSAMVHATRMTLTTPRAVITPRSRERSSTVSEPGAGGQVRRSSDPGTSAFRRHGVPRSLWALRSLAWITRSATVRLDSAKVLSLSSSLRPTGSSSIFTSTRSSSGPEIRPRYRRRMAGLQLQPSAGPAIFAHGHGFAARTKVNLAGNRVMTPNLATTTSPASSGCRSASSTSLANSGASSRNRTPRWASDAEPGTIMPLPPPTIAALVAVW